MRTLYISYLVLSAESCSQSEERSHCRSEAGVSNMAWLAAILTSKQSFQMRVEMCSTMEALGSFITEFLQQHPH